MNKNKAKLRHAKSRRLRRLLAIGVVLASASVAIGAAAIAARRPSERAVTEPARNVPDQTASALAAPQDPQTGQIRPLTQDEAQRLAAALKELANPSTDGLKQTQHADGSVSINLDGRFQNIALARRNTDGSIAQGCIDNPQAGAAFFGIDPQLVGAESRPTNGTGKTPASIK